MPQRYIKIPSPVQLRDPYTKELLKDGSGNPALVTFKELMGKLMSNPMWNETYPRVRAADAVTKALYLAEKNGLMILAEEDWKLLDQAAQNPKQVVITGDGQGDLRTGYGWHPIMTPQLLPLLDAIVNALTEVPDLEKASA